MFKGDLNLWAKPHFTLISTFSRSTVLDALQLLLLPSLCPQPGPGCSAHAVQLRKLNNMFIWNLKFCVWSLWPKSTIPEVKKWTWSVRFKKYKIRNPWGSNICICSFSFKALFSKRDSLTSWRVTGSPWRLILSQLPILVVPLLQLRFLLCFVSHIFPRSSETQRMISAMTPAGGRAPCCTQISAGQVGEGITHPSYQDACFY